EAVSVLEAQHPQLRQRAVVDVDGSLALREMLQRDVHATIVLVVQHGVPLAECAALAVQSAQPDANARDRERRKCQRLRSGPVEWLFSARHGQTMVNSPLNFPERLKPRGHLRLRFQKAN